MKKIIIIDYGAGNIQSVKFALERLGYQSLLSIDPYEIENAEKIIFPGVGQAYDALQMLEARGLVKLIPQLKQPFLGICLGMQLMCSFSEEGNTKGLDIFPVLVKKFDTRLKVPHMGWNNLNFSDNKLFEGIQPGNHMYFVHSYYVPINQFTIAETEYGITFSSVIQKDNFYGCQFHPEKSGILGQKILQNFLML